MSSPSTNDHINNFLILTMLRGRLSAMSSLLKAIWLPRRINLDVTDNQHPAQQRNEKSLLDGGRKVTQFRDFLFFFVFTMFITFKLIRIQFWQYRIPSPKDEKTPKRIFFLRRNGNTDGKKG